MRGNKKKRVVAYHGNCTDGFGAAWAAWKHFGHSAEYVPVHLTDYAEIKDLRDREIYTLDFTPPRELLNELIKKNVFVTSIDHHITRKNEVPLTKDGVYDNSHSGSVLSWKYFHPKEKMPRLLSWVEDGDLWKFVVKGTKEVYAFLDLYHFNFKIWDKFAKEFENAAKRKKYLEVGSYILGYQDSAIERLAANNSDYISFEGHKLLAINSPVWNSQLGTALYKKYPPLAMIWHERKGRIIVSLRSDGSVDVAKLAEKYGGGGHRGASGFSFPVDKKFPWKRIKNEKA